MKFQRWMVLIIAGWYLLLITLHYFNQRPLWNDEYCIFLNIKQYFWLDFFSKPLLALQAFPRLYLLVIQKFATCFHYSLWALRFLPFVCMVLAFWVWAKIASLELKDNLNLGMYILSWAASVRLVYYASELKQYSMDVFLAGLCCYLLYQGFSYWWYLVPFLCWLSYPSLFWMPLIFWNLIAIARAENQWQPVLIYCFMGALAFGLFSYFDLRVGNAHLLSIYWHDYFISFDSPHVFLNSLGKVLNNLISRWFADKPLWVRDPARFFVGLGFVYMLIGFWAKFKEDRFIFKSTIPILGAVLFLHLLVGAMHKYPVGCPRTSLFLAPMLLMSGIMAMQAIKNFHKKTGVMLQGAYIIYLVIASAGIAKILCTGTLSFGSVLWQ